MQHQPPLPKSTRNCLDNNQLSPARQPELNNLNPSTVYE